MKKVFIVSICSVCNEPIGIISPSNELGYNNFPYTNFHGELSVEKTKEMRQHLIQSLKNKGDFENAEFIEKNTTVMEVTFNVI